MHADARLELLINQVVERGRVVQLLIPGILQEDVIQGYVSIEKAKEDYGVVVDAGTMKVDAAVTEKLRKSRRITG